jgi:hypothetical protein
MYTYTLSHDQNISKYCTDGIWVWYPNTEKMIGNAQEYDVIIGIGPYRF